MKKLIVLTVLTLSFLSVFAGEVESDCASMNQSRTDERVSVTTTDDSVQTGVNSIAE